MAHAADVMAFFASELDRPDDRARWLRLRARYRRRTQQLYDPTEHRFRDWLIQEKRLQEPRPDELYWGVDARCYSPLSLTPLLGGTARADQFDELRMEVRRHRTAPWTWWPSWSYALVECAAAAGLHDLAGQVAAEVLERVWPQNDRRTLADFPRPTPGAAREYWPADLRDWQASDAYGWGATTANLFMRHVMGIQESRDTTGWVLTLVPSVPLSLRQSGRTFGLHNCLYRGRLFDLVYTWTETALQAELTLREPAACRFSRGAQARPAIGHGRRGVRHTLTLANEQVHRLELRF
jgi:hypothetical protein